jgi:hypothetical protein
MPKVAGKIKLAWQWRNVGAIYKVLRVTCLTSMTLRRLHSRLKKIKQPYETVGEILER